MASSKSPVQAVIVAGGRGVRMRPATDYLPKPMLPVAGKPILEHLLEWLKRSGFTEATMCLGYLAEKIQAHFGDGARWGVALDYAVERESRGTAGCLKDLGPRLKGDALVVYGDLFVDMDCGKLLDFHRAHDGAATLVVRETDHPLDSDLVRVDGERIVGFYRAKAGEPYENLACAALWVVRPALLDLVPAERPSDFGKDVFPAALEERRKLMAYRTAELVVDLGTAERAAAFERRWSRSS